jgi:polysaccharide deacetylase 2 family uncharacterized protein YibQ
MADDLGAPLGRNKGKPGLRAVAIRNLPVARAVLTIIVLIVGAAALRIWLVNDPNGGRPSAEVAINTARDTNKVAAQNAAPTPAPAKPAATITADPAPPDVPPGASITTVGDSTPNADPASTDAAALSPDLVEQTKDGAIPRIGPSGQTPFAAYARASVSQEAASGEPLIAIVVTGLGLNEGSTLEAVSKLPGNVTLAFAPYGKTLQATVAAARSSGHEILLEVPLEPFDYPDNDPGPQTLLTGQPPRANLDKLFWLLARFGGYVGLINHMGARFTASAADFSPLMEELGARGLGYIDDGSSNRSLAPQLAAQNKVPFSRADMELDLNPARGPILGALAALEAKAVANGRAVGVISALPVSVQTVSEWAKTLSDRNIMLVPVSALMK